LKNVNPCNDCLLRAEKDLENDESGKEVNKQFYNTASGHFDRIRGKNSGGAEEAKAKGNPF